ncbi:pyruvate, water dikinase regulatory protein [Paenibacillus sp. NEAU-GSW1]|uniref:pyruvate, water dikinase regulatory protein n=1 Tax=Paenibacillus sp. NEAU-GSW1 TaxID=2682486 RepID=UPI0012E2370C|nr:pyruvate, water dikinase regulatory protein [Paenibacillus sp. NEAU-GSW1]MUT68041.1 pyruvate, phosphate dikinase/phosphoenolpyruvate synthase regulator [Paenibacillus sp. NEAU-GSW1]
MTEMIIYVCSDAVGETAEAVAKATLRQFASDHVKIKRYGHMKTEDEVIQVVAEAARTGGFISYTLVQPELRELMKEEAFRWGVRAVDVMGPMMQAYVDTFGSFPKRKPGLLHSIDDDYYRRMDAIEFAVKYDDGKDARGFIQAQVVLIGVSRTSKTPLSVFLSHKGIKTANLPLMPEVKPPAELMPAPGRLIIGLTMQPEHLLDIRTERLLALGLPASAQYASKERILEELAYAENVMKSFHCPVIDVTNRAIEETAGIIIEMLYKQSEIGSSLR